MKKQNRNICTLTIALCVLPALSVCAANGSAVQTEQAYADNAKISTTAQTKAEETHQSEIAAQYAIYEPYGMTYNKEKDHFYYHGQMVRYFKDVVSTAHTNGFFFADGVVDVVPIKDENQNCIGLQQASTAAFQAETEKQQTIKAELDAACPTEINGSFELGEPNHTDDSLDAYTVFGVSYDQIAKKWTYHEKIIHILYDADHNTYYDGSASDGICLIVLRDKNGSIATLTETDAQELAQAIK